MSNVDVEIISKEAIRPYSPTPPHLRSFTLSLLDQLSPMYYVPIAFFFPMSDHSNLQTNQILHQLKDSLSQTLSIFYPLAGRVKNHLTIDCNDDGVLFSVAKVSCHFPEFLRQPKTELLDQFHPRLDISPEKLNLSVQVAIQLNIFLSGGIVIGLSFLHQIVDAATMRAFLGCWVAIASGSNDISPYPDYTAALLFPPRKSLDNNNHASPFYRWFMKKEKGVWQRFVFDAATISALKAKATNEAGVPNPTRFESVTGFIWKSQMAASRALGSKQPSMMMVAVNLRPKMMPPMPENSIGNIIWQATAHHDNYEGEEIELSSVVGMVRGAVKEINGNFAQNLQGEEGVLRVQRYAEELREMYSEESPPPHVYTCSSWCKFGFYDVDFGWGKPVWVSYTGGVVSNPLYANTIVLMETKSGDGIEAWVILPETQMAKLLCDTHFLAFASFNPPCYFHMNQSAD